MHLVYIDEVKHDPSTQRYHWLCALAFPESCLQDADSALRDFANQFLGSSLLSVETEFHGKAILQGKGPYKKRQLSERVDLYKALVNVIMSARDIGRIEIRIEPARMLATTHQDMALMFPVEKVDDYMRQKSRLHC